MPDPTGVAVSEKQHQRGIRLKDAAVFSANLEDEVEVRLIARELVPVAEVGSDNGVATHGQPTLAGDVVRQVGTDKVDSLVRIFLMTSRQSPWMMRWIGDFLGLAAGAGVAAGLRVQSVMVCNAALLSGTRMRSVCVERIVVDVAAVCVGFIRCWISFIKGHLNV
jgi:hypothetical protein